MSLQKNFPRERKYYFWAIFLCHRIASDPSSSEMDRKLFGTLAYRMISKAVTDVPSNPVCNSSKLYLFMDAGLDLRLEYD
jgi:N-terminal acetyltransferase B complex non-catalytic subunit